jgi:hypothetical protein
MSDPTSPPASRGPPPRRDATSIIKCDGDRDGREGDLRTTGPGRQPLGCGPEPVDRPLRASQAGGCPMVWVLIRANCSVAPDTHAPGARCRRRLGVEDARYASRVLPYSHGTGRLRPVPPRVGPWCMAGPVPRRRTRPSSCGYRRGADARLVHPRRMASPGGRGPSPAIANRLYSSTTGGHVEVPAILPRSRRVKFSGDAVVEVEGPQSIPQAKCSASMARPPTTRRTSRPGSPKRPGLPGRLDNRPNR